MPEMYKAMKLLVGMDLGGKVCVVTDGRFSGSNNGCFVGHICPEAAEDGPIAYLQDGDIITVDVQSGLIEAPEVNLEKRRADSPYQYRRQVNGYLHQYAKNVKNASHGAVIPVREETDTAPPIPLR